MGSELLIKLCDHQNGLSFPKWQSVAANVFFNTSLGCCLHGEDDIYFFTHCLLAAGRHALRHVQDGDAGSSQSNSMINLMRDVRGRIDFDAK